MRKLQVLGTGCPKCERLAQNAETAAKELGIEYELKKVTQINDIMKFGVMMTPALLCHCRTSLSSEELWETPKQQFLSCWWL